MLGVAEAAELLGVNQQRVRQFIAEGRLPAALISGVYVIDEDTLADFAIIDRAPGRPSKQKEG